MSTSTQAIVSHWPVARARRAKTPSLLPLLLLFGTAKLLLQVGITLLSQHAGYGIFRDELYYLVCGHRLAFGYVDQPPIAALQARAAEVLFGTHHLVLFRLLPNLAGTLMVVLTGLIAQALGGGRRGAAYAMLAVLTVPVFLSTQSFLSMNAWEPVFWMSAVLALIHVLADPRATRWWLLLGVSGGLGLENKASTLFFLVALLLGLLAVPARRILRTRGFALALAVTVALALPNLLWQVHNHFPTYEWLRDVQHSSKDVVLSPLRFLLAQVFMVSPFHLLVWVPGLIWLLRSRQFRVLGLLYVFFLGIMLLLHAKDYYLAPIYPLLFAAGGGALAQWARIDWARLYMSNTYCALLVLSAGITAPFAVPVLSPAQYTAYSRTMHFAPIESEQHPGAPFPEFFADHLDWQRLADGVARVYRSLPQAEQKETGIFASNYGQASALTILGNALKLPEAISGHQNYWLWGPRGYTGKEMIVVSPAPLEELLHSYRSCTVADHQTSPYQMPWEQRFIYVCHDRLRTYGTSWNELKLYR